MTAPSLGTYTNTISSGAFKTTSGNTASISTATFTVLAQPTVKVQKTSVGRVGIFSYTLTGLNNTTDAVTTSTSGTAVSSGQTNTGTAGTAATITETAASAGGYTTAVTCTDANAATDGNGAASPISSSTTAVTIPAANMVGGAAWTCAYTNTLVLAPTISKKMSPNNPTQGNTTRLSITLTNPNSAAINNLTLTDDIATTMGIPGLTILPGTVSSYPGPYVAGKGGPDTCLGTPTETTANGVFTLTGGVLPVPTGVPATEGCTIVMTVSIPYNAPTGSKTNTIQGSSVTGKVGGISTPTPPDATFTLTVGAATPDLSIKKTQTTASSVAVGSSVSYTLVAWNNSGNLAAFANTSNAVITDTVPNNLTSVSWTCAASGSASCGSVTSGTGNAISLTTGALPVNNTGGSVPSSGDYLTITVTATASTVTTPTLTNTATIAAASGVTDNNSNGSTKSSSVTTTIAVAPIITLNKYQRVVTAAAGSTHAAADYLFTKSALTAAPKDVLEYCIVYSNTGGAAPNFKLTDNVPGSSTALTSVYPSGTPTSGIYYAAGKATAASDAAPPTGGVVLTNASGDDAGTLTASNLKLDLGATGVAAGTSGTPTVGTVCFQTRVN
ncbi:prealbumin-like fold domain-containing protein [Deinococcus sp.]|uniref:prealbumin-like fold domain-containing protein n=1 Tax=Deinococcus sp. TaxID=47478 RepID=UPI003CC5D39F